MGIKSGFVSTKTGLVGGCEDGAAEASAGAALLWVSFSEVAFSCTGDTKYEFWTFGTEGRGLISVTWSGRLKPSSENPISLLKLAGNESSFCLPSL